jgi:hypothetical protein
MSANYLKNWSDATDKDSRQPKSTGARVATVTFKGSYQYAPRFIAFQQAGNSAGVVIPSLYATNITAKGFDYLLWIRWWLSWNVHLYVPSHRIVKKPLASFEVWGFCFARLEPLASLLKASMVSKRQARSVTFASFWPDSAGLLPFGNIISSIVLIASMPPG